MKTEVLQYDSGEIAARLDRSERRLVSGVSFCLKEGETLALIGETGSGKTITAQSIMRLLPDNVKQSGESIRYFGEELPSPRKMKKLLGVDIVYIPQNGAEFLNPSRKIRHHLYDSLKKLHIPPDSLEKLAQEKLSLAGLEEPELPEQYPFQLSGGMAQRVTIALAACSQARLVIADEPTNGLDHASKEAFMSLLAEMFPEAAKLVITHDIAVAELCDSTLVLCGGKMMERGPSELILQSPHQPYTRALLASLVKNGMHETPVLRRETGFCPFYRRCPLAGESCRERQEYRSSGNLEWWCNEKI